MDRINGVMEPRGRDPRRDGKDTVIGVLDIYGFEVFPVNRWVVQPPHHTLWSPQPPGPSQSWGAWLCWGAECLAFGAVGPLPQAHTLKAASAMPPSSGSQKGKISGHSRLLRCPNPL